MNIKNAIIKRGQIHIENGQLCAWLDLDFGGCGQAFGGWCLYLPKDLKHHKLESPAGHFIYRVLEVAGVTDWSRLPGQAIRVNGDAGRIKAIGHIIKDDWFDPGVDFKSIN